MKAKLNKKTIVKNIPSEEMLLEFSVAESIYAIRKLKAAIIAEDDVIEFSKTNDYKQAFSEEHQMWFEENEYTPVG